MLLLYQLKTLTRGGDSSLTVMKQDSVSMPGFIGYQTINGLVI